MAWFIKVPDTYGKQAGLFHKGYNALTLISPVRSVQTNNIATRDPTTCRDMSACITLTRIETTLSCAWSWHNDPRAATEAGDAEQVADISATGRRKPRPGHQLDLTPTFNLFISCTAVATGFSFLLALTKTFTSSSCAQVAAWAQ
jgi:hypothetical protein